MLMPITHDGIVVLTHPNLWYWWMFFHHLLLDVLGLRVRKCRKPEGSAVAGYRFRNLRNILRPYAWIF
uniref:Putative secreted protein n=1 Tax=Anopheles darlingi TaxID=43151 RepID=A0A2M4DHU4_ANODA